MVALKSIEFIKVEKMVSGLKVRGNTTKEQTSISDGERDVLYLLTKEFLTVKQVSIRRKCSLQAVYKIRKSLVDKGFLRANIPQEMQVEKNEGCIQPLYKNFQPLNSIRLHAEQFVLGVLWKDDKRYRQGDLIVLDGNSVRLGRSVVEVFSNTSFFGETPAVADSKALRYWMSFFNRLQDRFKVILLKDGSQNIRRVRAEYAETNNELAKQIVESERKVRVFGDDGKLWLTFDDSKGLREAEAVHSEFGRFDMEDVVQPFFNDLRRSPVTLSEIKGLIGSLASETRELASGLSVVVSLLKPVQYARDDNDRRVDYVG